jgi:MHS family shikimate/dehydroshikimate transporter-like MFS transporter
VYGLIAPSVFEGLFFPHANAVAGTIAVLGTFAIGYGARPLGGIVFGHLGDRFGRKPIMFSTLVLMGASTTLIGLLPTYATIGIWAPVLLVLLRFSQGFALGGETVGAVVLAIESAPRGRRGGYAGVIQVGAAMGSVLASFAAMMVARMPKADMQAWGWRAPFVASAVLVLVGVYVRIKVSESPLFRRALATTEQRERLPLITALRREPKACVTTFLCTITETSMLQMFTVYALVYGVQTLHIDRAVLLNGVLIGNLFGIVANPLFGRISDFVGRRPMIAASLLIGAGYVAFVYFPLLRSQNTVLITLAIAIPPAVIQTLIFAVEGSFYAELFRSARQRFSGLGFSRQLGGVLGGLFPIFATSLFVTTGTIWSVIGYYVAVSAISLGAVLAARETRLEELG